ncbi:histidine phosphatase family protein [Nocardioides sp. JQ2195]|uniref:histidine phosphatase family protein n=1 Tax=Nocardioides sp. JQ2195 TaxID=2592334 RepID=UPI00143EB743|nr:histidine phosphatase family protein [Nocardioides sp. JQ2195]QIX28329.1 histidine phosphatase family protein [Nocardioides sp. JQ2195]
MGQMLLVRHGQASWGTEDYDVLSSLGWEQGRLLGKALGGRGLVPDLVVQGGMRRHRETAEAIVEAAGWGAVEVVTDPGWDEFDHIDMLAKHPAPEGEELDRVQFQAWFERASARWTSGGNDHEYAESFPAFAARIDDALARTAARVSTSSTVLVVTSGGPISLAASALLTERAADLSATSYAVIWGELNKVVVNSSMTKVVVGRGGTRLVSFNEHSHLEGDGLTYR